MRCGSSGRCAKWVLSLSDDRHSYPCLALVAEGWDTGLNIASFAEDTNGELFLVDVRDSTLYKLVPGS
jgi:hypothetical protein